MSYHPSTEEIDLAAVMATLGDSTRLAILGHLDKREGAPMMCSDFTPLASKSNLTYHLGRMREAGIIRVEKSGTAKMITIRRADLDARFPGFLDTVLKAAEHMSLPSLDAECEDEAVVEA
ncbi:MAG: transcriptional regulator [Rhizobiales bacterium]|nr:transcriptional regulator [Hyphomicrobiales bacterium]|tara:strand:- start:432 stop:791 length:360 start_codon:yes stop_codon:yes gene_type:complete